MAQELSEQTMQELDDAAGSYVNAVDEIMKRHSSEELLAYASDASEEKKSLDFESFHKWRANMEVLYRRVFARAEPILNASGSSGCYCVFHDRDMKDCGEEHND